MSERPYTSYRLSGTLCHDSRPVYSRTDARFIQFNQTRNTSRNGLFGHAGIFCRKRGNLKRNRPRSPMNDHLQWHRRMGTSLQSRDGSREGITGQKKRFSSRPTVSRMKAALPPSRCATRVSTGARGGVREKGYERSVASWQNMEWRATTTAACLRSSLATSSKCLMSIPGGMKREGSR